MTLRVIAGNLGGRRLVTPTGLRTRPTSERVRQALFDILADVAGAVVLDLYAGTGALGIEALSRGAARATFVESWREALHCLERNLNALGLEARARVVRARVEAAGAQVSKHGPFDLIFCDPPWPDMASALAALPRCLDASSLSPGARVVIEHPERDGAIYPPEMLGLTLCDQRNWGDTALSFFSAKS